MIVILLVADSLKASAPGFAGGGARTPYLDRLAADGTSFQSMMAGGAWTVPSLMSMLTGSPAHRVGVCRWRHPFPARRPTLLTAFAAAGFEVSCFHPYPEWGLLTVAGRGWSGNSQEPDAVRQALAGRKGRDRFVLLLHWWTHLPYLNRHLSREKWHAACDFSLESLHRHPLRLAGKMEDLYFQSVAYFSEEILPKYLEAAGANGEEVLLAVTGDHGETWGRSLPAGRRVEQIYDLHGRWIADETIQVPFVLYGKGVPAGQSIGGLASGADIGPTLADLAGVPWPGPAPEKIGPGLVERPGEDWRIIGRSLAPSVREGTPSPRQEVLTLTSHNTHAPRTYPADGKEMWRTFALRTTEAWYIWDGVEQSRTVTPIGNARLPDDGANDEIFARLELHRQEAVDSAPIVEDQTVAALRGEESQVRQRLRDLGYLD